MGDTRDGGPVETDFQEFVRIRYGELLRTAFLLTGSTVSAEDLVQGALVQAMRRWRRIDDPMAYLWRSMVNQRTNRWRRVTSREVLVGALPEALTRGWVRADQTEQLAERDRLLRALATLPPRMRAVLVLRYWEDLSEAATAAVLGCSTGTVKAQSSRGLARLRTVLAPPRTASDPPFASGRALTCPVRAGAAGAQPVEETR